MPSALCGIFAAGVRSINTAWRRRARNSAAATHRWIRPEAIVGARQPIDPALRRLLDQQAVAIAALGSFAQMSDAQRVQTRRSLLQRALESRGTIPGLPHGVGVRDL